MKKVAATLLIVVGVLCLVAPAMAQPEAHGDTPAAQAAAAGGGSGFLLLQDAGAAKLGAAIGAGLVIIGGAAGLGRIGGSATESMARQPEAAGSINTIALITAAMLEGATLFAVVVCLLAIVL